jgi:hypothetical protein
MTFTGNESRKPTLHARTTSPQSFVTGSESRSAAVVVSGDRATIRWRYRFGDGDENSVRGVNLMHVRDGKIMEALGYVKSNLRP